MNEFLSTLGDNRHDTSKKVTKPRKRRNSGGLDAFDSFYNSSSGNVGYPEGLLVLKPLLIQSHVCLNSKIAEVTAKTLQGLLTCVVVSDKAKKNKILGGIFNPLTTLSGVLYDAGQELLSCHGSMNTKAGELFCTVDPKVWMAHIFSITHSACSLICFLIIGVDPHDGQCSVRAHTPFSTPSRAPHLRIPPSH